MRASDMRLADIRCDDTYSFSYPSLPGRYEGVADRFPGMPLLVVDGERRVVCGHDLFQLLRRRDEAQVRVLQVELALAEGLLLNFNVLDGLFELNLYEKLLFVSKVSPWLAPGEIQRRAALGFSLNDSLRQRLPILLSEPFRDCFALGRLGLKTALKLANQPETDRMAVLGIFQASGFSESLQGLIVQSLEEIAFREKKPIVAILAAGGLPGLLEGEMPQKKFMEALNRMRYPAFSRMEREWSVWRNKAATGNGLSIRHAPFFSREEVQITLTVKNRVEAEKLLAKLKKIG
jgi:hypothetical protein